MSKEKKRIGEKAASLIEPHDTIIIDPGSTTEFLAQYIDSDMPITALTYALKKQIRASKVFISASGVSDKLGVTGLNLYEIEPKKSAIESSVTRILLADSSKFDQVKIAHIADLSDFNIIITDTNVPPHYEEHAKEHEITLFKV